MADVEMADIAPADPLHEDDDAMGSDEGEGEAINPLSDDSSEEALTDEEEAKVVQKGFIVDDDDEDADSDAEEVHQQQRRRKRRKRRGQSLDDDDLALLEENTGTRVSRPRTHHLSRVRRGRGSTSRSPPPAPVSRRLVIEDVEPGSESDVSVPDVSHIFDDRPRDNRGLGEDLDMDDDDGFIDDDDDDLDGDMGEEEREQLRQEKRRDVRERKRAMVHRPDGIDAGAWDEIFEVFGDGTDFDWALDDEDMDMEEAPKEMQYQDVFEPSEISARFMDHDDNVIRANDIPERMQLATSSLSSSSTLTLPSEFPASELDAASYWVSLRISPRTEHEIFRPDGKYHEHLEAFSAAVSDALHSILCKNHEVPYIWTHRRDNLSVFTPGGNPPRIELLSRTELWRVGVLGARYRALYERKETLRQTYERMGVEDKYYEGDIIDQVDSVEVVADVMDWLCMKYPDRHRDALEVVEAGRQQKKPNRVSAYERVKATPISKLAVLFGIDVPDIVRNVTLNQKEHFTDDPELHPLEMAEQFPALGFEKGSDILQNARMLVATELGRDPLLRRIARERFWKEAIVSVSPTEKGITKIDEQHPYYAFKYMRDKRVADLRSDAQFLRMLAAEAEHLVTISIQLPQGSMSEFQEEIYRAYASDGYSDVANEWNLQRRQVVNEAVEKFLIPVGIKHIREKVREDVEDQLITRCAHMLQERIDVSPYPSTDLEKGETPAVLALSWGKGDPQKDPILAVFLDDAGRLREHARFDNLIDPNNRSEFNGLVSRRKPDLIVVGGFTIMATKLLDRVKEVLGQPQEDQNGGGLGGWGDEDNGASSSKRSVPVVFVPDEVARIYQHSKRAVDEFSVLPPIGRYCVGLARYAQSPVNEYAALGADLVAITFDEDQQLLSEDKLLTALERALVNIVNDVGVDINRCVTDSYYRLLLPFVCGLGPRKAQVILKHIGNLGGNVINRERFIYDGIMTSNIFVNAAAFLKITQEPGYDDSRGRRTDSSKMPDPLDATRVHPEDYELARKMATDALELDDEDYADQHESYTVKQLMQDEAKSKKLDDLSLDDYALSLLQTQETKKRNILDMVHDELLRPFGDNRQNFTPMTDWEIVTQLTGETRRTLYAGRILTVTVGRVKPTHVDVRLESGLDGVIDRALLTSEQKNPAEVAKPRQSIQAVVVSVEIDHGRFRIQLAARPEDIAGADQHARRPKVDENFDHQAANHDKDLVQRKQRNEVDRTRRVIKHPAFKPFGSKEAVAYLAPLQRGDAVIRPSSKGHDHLAVTWKVSDGIYQHIDVVEIPDQFGSQYIVDNRQYVDLDDLLVNHVKAMSRKVDELVDHEKFKEGSEDAVSDSLTNFVRMNPTRSSYAFGLDRNKPGHFNLSFLPNLQSPVQTWHVKVTPTAYRLFDVEVGSVADLCDAFKRMHQKDMRSMGVNGKTPYGAGRMTPARGAMTPGRAGGATPRGNATPFGRTPAPYANIPPPQQPFQPVAQTPSYGGSTQQWNAAPPPMMNPPMAPPSTFGMNPERARLIAEATGYGQTPRR